MLLASVWHRNRCITHLGFLDESLGAWCTRCGCCTDCVVDGLKDLVLRLEMVGCEDGEEEDGLADEEEGLEGWP